MNRIQTLLNHLNSQGDTLFLFEKYLDLTDLLNQNLMSSEVDQIIEKLFNRIGQERLDNHQLIILFKLMMDRLGIANRLVFVESIDHSRKYLAICVDNKWFCDYHYSNIIPLPLVIPPYINYTEELVDGIQIIYQSPTYYIMHGDQKIMQFK